MTSKKSVMKFTIFIILIFIIFLILDYYDVQSQITTENLRSIITSYGALAPIVYIIIYNLASVLFLPGSLLTITGGLLFGTIKGTIYAVIGATLGATLAFLIARYFARSFIEDFIEKKYPKIKEFDNKLEKNGFITILFLRFIPIFPFNGLNFALGLTKVKLKDYFLATLIGIIPGTLVYVYLGDSIAEMNFLNIILAIVLIILLSLSINVYKVYKKRKIK